MTHRLLNQIARPLVLSLLLLLLLMQVPNLYAASDWSASYWNNRTLSGPPILQRTESALDHNWGVGSPDPLINSDEFSARWERAITASAGMHRLIATTDDGMRVWVAGNLVIDSWYDIPATRLIS